MSLLNIRLKPEPLRSLAFGSITGSYANIGTGFAHPSVILHVQNDTNAALLISFSQEVDHEFLAAGGFLLLDVASNRSNLSESRSFSQGTIIQVKSASGNPSSGSIYLSTYYAG